MQYRWRVIQELAVRVNHSLAHPFSSHAILYQKKQKQTSLGERNETYSQVG